MVQLLKREIYRFPFLLDIYVLQCQKPSRNRESMLDSLLMSFQVSLLRSCDWNAQEDS